MNDVVDFITSIAPLITAQQYSPSRISALLSMPRTSFVPRSGRRTYRHAVLRTSR